MSNTNNKTTADLAADGFISAGGGNITFLKPKDMKAGQTVKGTLIKKVTNQFGGEDYRIDTANGVVGIGGSKHLSFLLADVAVGSQVLVTYTGAEILKKGPFKGKSSHNFEVLYKPGARANSTAADNGQGQADDDVSDELSFDE